MAPSLALLVASPASALALFHLPPQPEETSFDGKQRRFVHPFIPPPPNLLPLTRAMHHVLPLSCGRPERSTCPPHPLRLLPPFLHPSFACNPKYAHVHSRLPCSSTWSLLSVALPRLGHPPLHGTSSHWPYSPLRHHPSHSSFPRCALASHLLITLLGSANTHSHCAGEDSLSLSRCLLLPRLQPLLAPRMPSSTSVPLGLLHVSMQICRRTPRLGPLLAFNLYL